MPTLYLHISLGNSIVALALWGLESQLKDAYRYYLFYSNQITYSYLIVLVLSNKIQIVFYIQSITEALRINTFLEP